MDAEKIGIGLGGREMLLAKKLVEFALYAAMYVSNASAKSFAVTVAGAELLLALLLPLALLPALPLPPPGVAGRTRAKAEKMVSAPQPASTHVANGFSG